MIHHDTSGYHDTKLFSLQIFGFPGFPIKQNKFPLTRHASHHPSPGGPLVMVPFRAWPAEGSVEACGMDVKLVAPRNEG